MFSKSSAIKSIFLRKINSKNFHRSNILKKEVEIFVNDKPIKVDSSYTIFQACYEAKEIIPRFCYHEKLAIAGNCRMCLVEIAACAMPVMAGMRINTKSDKTRVARGGVLEFLLANHPLDCPICDQGGECDLQDISEVYGYGIGRYNEYKRSVEDKNLGPIVKTTMSRCIHCTRCIRFSEDIAGDFNLGMTGRGLNTEISTYIENLVHHELSGNIVDLCPVGALTSNPYAFKARPWELKQNYTIDTFESILPSVQFDSRGAEVMRVLPKVNELANEEWLSDKSRHAFDGIKRQRINVPMKKDAKNNYIDLSWDQALDEASRVLSTTNPKEIAVMIGDQADIESITAVRDMMLRLGVDDLEFRSDSLKVDPSLRSGYLMNSRLRGVEDCDLLLLVGTNPRIEAPVFNARIKKSVTKNNLRVGLIGSQHDLSYPYEHLGTTPKSLIEILEGNHPFSARIANAKLPMIIFGSSVFQRSDGLDFYKLATKVSKLFMNKEKKWNGFNILHKDIGNIGALEIGIKLYDENRDKKSPKVIYLLSCDDYNPNDIPSDAYVIYQGTHGDRGAERANLILAGATYVEKSGTYVSTDGRVDTTRQVIQPPFLAREDWAIIRALSENLGITLPYDDLFEVRNRMCELAPHLIKYDYNEKHGFEDLLYELFKNDDIAINNTNLVDTIDNYYMTNNISRASPTMAKCSHAFNKKRFKNFSGSFV